MVSPKNRWVTMGFLEESWSSTLYSFSLMLKLQKSSAGNRASIFRDNLSCTNVKTELSKNVYNMCGVAFYVTAFVENDIKGY